MGGTGRTGTLAEDVGSVAEGRAGSVGRRRDLEEKRVREAGERVENETGQATGADRSGRRGQKEKKAARTQRMTAPYRSRSILMTAFEDG